jgi:nucleoside-diphosphate-sugar epimerase
MVQDGMKILVTGNLGYIGSVLTPFLEAGGHEVTGLDTGYFEECLFTEPKRPRNQVYKDIRDVEASDFSGFDGVVHLAGLSNDPLGELNPGLTEEINLHGTIRAAGKAREAGVSRFVFASSQSMYGVSTTDAELDEDLSDKAPVTAYARTKWEAELALREFASDSFCVTAFRPSTVFGASPRLRCDIVFNNLVACAFTKGRIEIKSDGTPWRPVVHVRDVCQALAAGLIAPPELVQGRGFNVGIPNGNFSVADLAEAARQTLPGVELTYTGEHGKDSRSYRVSFARILHELAEYFRPEWGLDRGGRELVDFFKQTGFTEADFVGKKAIRLQQLKELLGQGRLNADLRWT